MLLAFTGIPDFDALHSRRHDEEVQLYALHPGAGRDDLRKLPRSMRKQHLVRLLVRRPAWIFVDPFEKGEIGPDLFQAACSLGLEGLVSKRADRPYRAGRSKDWVKNQEPQASGLSTSAGSVLKKSSKVAKTSQPSAA